MGVSLFPFPLPPKQNAEKREFIGFESLEVWFEGESYEPF